jgi:hypothetical protein
MDYVMACFAIILYKKWGIIIEKVRTPNYLDYKHDLSWSTPTDCSTNLGDGIRQTKGKAYDHNVIMQ